MGNMTGTQSPTSLIALIRAGEPFRLLFPLGLAIGILGVLLWPLWLWGPLSTYPSVSHARIMILGFQTAFIMGFLGTALPRLLEVPRLGLGAAALQAVGLILVTVLHLGHWTLAGDAAFVLLLAAFLVDLGRRARQRRDVPPPAFVLVIAGLLSGLLGGALQVCIGASSGPVPAPLFSLANLLLYQGYLLLPILGVSAFMLPRFFGLPNRQSFPESMVPPPGWLRRAAFAAACGAAILLGFILEAFDLPHLGNLLRAGAFVTFFLVEVPAHQRYQEKGSLINGLRVAIVSIPLGYLALAIWPEWRTTLLHIVFITGFSLITLVVASRVLLGHSGQGHLFRARIWPVRILVWAFIIAMLTRVTADWMPDIRLSHYAYAAICWAIGAAVWARRLLPAVCVPDADE